MKLCLISTFFLVGINSAFLLLHYFRLESLWSVVRWNTVYKCCISTCLPVSTKARRRKTTSWCQTIWYRRKSSDLSWNFVKVIMYLNAYESTLKSIVVVVNHNKIYHKFILPSQHKVIRVFYRIHEGLPVPSVLQRPSGYVRNSVNWSILMKLGTAI